MKYNYQLAEDKRVASLQRDDMIAVRRFIIGWPFTLPRETLRTELKYTYSQLYFTNGKFSYRIRKILGPQNFRTI